MQNYIEGQRTVEHCKQPKKGVSDSAAQTAKILKGRTPSRVDKN